MPLFASMQFVVYLLIPLALLFVPFILGGWLARRFRMPDYGWKIGLCLFLFFVSSYVVWVGWPPKFGIDLSGGAILIYQVEKTDQPIDMEKLCQKIGLRVNPGGQKEVAIRPYGADQVEIIIPNVDEGEKKRIEKRISTIGSLEFRILANKRDHAQIIELAKKEDAKDVKDEHGKLLAWWVPVKQGEERGFLTDPDIATRERTEGAHKILEVLVVNDDQNVKGELLSSSSAGTDQSGNPCVQFSFNAEGAERFGTLTGDNLPDPSQNFTRKLGIILDRYLCSAPSIQSRITSHGEITGRFTKEEVNELVNVLNSGSLPATLSQEPISDLFIGPTLGLDTIEHSKNAMILASILVMLFMFVYYRFAGLVANIALVLNMLVLLALMISVKAALTLSGLAGLALTVGMAVDNNVLVYERLREELAAGATLRMAIRNAFQRAAAVIIDANLTTLIAAIVLYVIGTDQVKGFAVALGLGVTISMFTSVFVARVIFDIAERREWIKDVKMLHVISRTNIDFMGFFRYCGTFSLIITVLGLVVTWQRGKGLLDIDFTGGVSVQTLFVEPVESVQYVRNAVESAKTPDNKPALPDVVVTDVKMTDEPALTRFVVNTSLQNQAEVQKILKEIFGSKLARNKLTIDKVETIPAEKPAKEGETVAPAVSAYVGGTKAHLTFAFPMDHDTVQDLIAAAAAKFSPGGKSVGIDLTNSVYTAGSAKSYAEWNLKLLLPLEESQKALDALKTTIASTTLFPASNTIGSAVASNTQQQAVVALLVSWACMLLYLWIRFQGVAFGLAAVVALVHDVLVILAALALSYWLATPLGFLGVEPFKVNLTIIAAFLTIVGYSVNDTIIVFDRIREVRGKSPFITREIVNQSTNQTLSRTLITSFTVLLVCVILYIAGGSAIHGFAFALMVGVATGTYSSVYIAAPILLWLVKPRDGKKIA